MKVLFELESYITVFKARAIRKVLMNKHLFSDVLMLRYNLPTLAHHWEIWHDTYFQGFLICLKAVNES
jgi:beta-xylosidase